MSIRHICALSILPLLVGCHLPPPPQDGASTDETGDPPPLADCAKQRAEVEGVVRERCADCHDHGNTKGGLGSITALDRLIADGLVVRGDADNSILYKQVASKAMPLAGEPLDAAQLSSVREWIDVCTVVEKNSEDLSLAEAPGCEEENAILPVAGQLAAIRDDIVRLDAADAKDTRYLSLAHLRGAGYCEPQIEGFRHALNKLLNHLSLSPNIHTPEAIDEARTIYRINLIDYGWSKATWESITNSDPYAVVFQSEDARDIRDSADVDLFAVKADWFIDAASQPPLYHTILELPATRAELEASLGIDVAANIDQESNSSHDLVVRAGFQKSNVSFSNRVVERHELPIAPRRAYWLSYDFAKAGPGQSLAPEKNIFEHPLDFVQDGGEIIFNLANGLQAYMLVDALGNRIDRGPFNVVHDQETPEEPEVINGLSCMSCHSEGMRPATDEIAGFIADNPDFETLAQEQAARLYAPADDFTRLLRQDIATFVDAMDATGALRQVGGREPVMAAHLAFAGPVDLRRAAAEFGVQEVDLLKKLPSMQGLTTLDRVTVTRDAFQDNFAFNACVLKLGNTAACLDDSSDP